MDVRLQNAYVEVLLENFISVIKQNIMFQAQIEVMNKSVSEAEEVKRKITELSEANISLQQALDVQKKEREKLTSDIASLKATDGKESVESLRQEKIRLQTAVNDYMRQVRNVTEQSNVSKKEFDRITAEIKTQLDEQNKYIEKLEELVPVSKLRKIKKTDITVQTPEQDDNVKSGGSF